MQRNQACFGSYDCLKNQASEAAEVWWLGFKKSLDKILWAKLLNHMDWNVMHSGMAPLLQAHAWRSLQHSQGQSSCHLPTQQSSHAVKTSVADTYSTSSTRMIIRNVSDMHCICICRPATSVISFSENTSLGSIKEKNACTGSVDEPETRHPLLKFAPRLPWPPCRPHLTWHCTKKLLGKWNIVWLEEAFLMISIFISICWSIWILCVSIYLRNPLPSFLWVEEKA